jgi:hypothetical protein
MKNLYFLDEEEKNRILNIHESTTKKQYLREEETNVQRIARNLYTGFRGPGTDTSLTTGLPAWISQIKDIPTYNAVNAQLALQSGGYPDIPSMINGETIDVPGMRAIMNHLKTIGIQSTDQISKSGDWLQKGTFKITSTTPITNAKKEKPATKTQVADPKITQQQKVQQRRKQITQQTQNTTKEIQKLLGQDQTGNLDSLNVERMIDLLKQ